MDELLKALGLQLYIDQVAIRIQTFKVFVEESKPISPYTIGSGLSGITTFRMGNIPYFIPTVIWAYKTEFGQQLEQYHQQQAVPPYYYPVGMNLQGISSQPGQIITTTGTGTFGGFYGGGMASSLGSSGIQSGAALSQQAALQQQLTTQQAMARYPITSSSAVPQGQLIIQSPSATVVIKNLDTDDKGSWVKRIKEWVSGATS